MAGQLSASCLKPADMKPSWRYRVAEQGDLDAINHLLAVTPMGGEFSITLERKPDPFKSDFGLSQNHLIVLSEDQRSGALAGMCERTAYRAFVNGCECTLDYIGALRVLPEFRNRIGLLRGGFDAVRRLGKNTGSLPFSMTSIASDNQRAMRLLTANLPGIPRYQAVGRYSTFVLRASKASLPENIRRATKADLPAIAALLNRENARFQFAPVWTAQSLADLSPFGLKPENFFICRQAAGLSGCLAAWDQSACRQTVVHSYPKSLAWLRPLWNLATPITGRPRLPSVGLPLKQVALSHCAVADDNHEVLFSLVDAALADAANREFECGYIGLSSANPLCAHLKRRYRAIEYSTELHTVHWSDNRQEQEEPVLDPALLVQPEAGLL